MIAEYILTAAWYIIQIYFYAIIFYVLSSWIPPLHESRFGQFVGRFVEPYLNFFRRFIPPIGMIDLSPIIALIAYNWLIATFAYNGLAALLHMIF